MATRASKKVVIAAIISNVAIALCKYIAAAFTGSSAMLAEALHSTVDTGNEILLAVGMKRSTRPPSSLHPFGHGKVMYFYSLLVAVYTFGMGGGLAVHHAIAAMRKPQMPEHMGWNYAVLALSAGLDFYSWRISYLEMHKGQKAGETIWYQIIRSKDPAVFTVFLEDLVSLIGTFLAFAGILAGQILHNPYFDPVASLLIGLLLIAVAVLLGRESGALLVGERAQKASIQHIEAIIKREHTVERLGELLTMQLGPEEALLTASIRFRRDMNTEQLESAIKRIEHDIQSKEPDIKQIFIEADSLR